MNKDIEKSLVVHAVTGDNSVVLPSDGHRRNGRSVGTNPLQEPGVLTEPSRGIEKAFWGGEREIWEVPGQRGGMESA